jgi:hypothetical protein
VDYWVIHHPPLDFHGAGGRGRCPWLCEHAPSSRTGADGPQAEERAIAADAHSIARVLCDEFLLFVFLAEALKKNTVCPVVKKRSRQIAKCMFLFEQSYLSERGRSFLLLTSKTAISEPIARSRFHVSMKKEHPF